MKNKDYITIKINVPAHLYAKLDSLSNITFYCDSVTDMAYNCFLVGLNEILTREEKDVL